MLGNFPNFNRSQKGSEGKIIMIFSPQRTCWKRDGRIIMSGDVQGTSVVPVVDEGPKKCAVINA